MRKLIFALTFGAILIPTNGFTLGLGEIEVNSSLNQELAARIDLLSAIPDDAESLLIRLASRDEFERAGLDRPMVLASLKFKTVVDDGKVYIDVYSPKPIREPFLNFLVEVDWPKGHLIREYTILLDPPTFMSGRQKAASVSGRPAMRASTSASVGKQSTTTDYRPAAQPASPSAPVATEEVYVEQQQTYTAEAEPQQQQATYTAPTPTPAEDHRVKRGDTAWSIAGRTRPDDSISIQQMMLAMLRLNPEAFIDGNVNALKRGYILRTPDYEDINAVSYEEAKAIVAQQNALWREYQQSLSSDQPAPAVSEPAVAEKASPAEAESSPVEVGMSDGSRLSIVSAGAGSSASGEMKDPSEAVESDLREQLALARERIETERVEKEALQQQVNALAQQIDKMKGLMTIQDDAMAEIQSMGASSDEAVAVSDKSGEMPVEEPAEEAVVEEPIEAADTAAEDKALGILDSATDALSELLSSEPSAEEELQAEPAAAEEADVEAAPAEIAPEEAVAPADELFADEAEQVVETDVATELEMLDSMDPDAGEQPQEKSLIDTLLDYRLIVLGLFVAILIILAILYLIKRGRRSSSSDDLSEDIFSTNNDDLDGLSDLVEDDLMDDLVSDEELEAAVAEEEAFDADATMILPSGTDTVQVPAADTVITPAAKQQQPPPVEEEEQDDVLAEADVYLAYGIYQQAEELLENAIKDNPDKDSYRVKLAETYFAGKNADALAKLGAEMKARVGSGETPAWAKVAALGMELCPEAEVFQNTGTSATVDMDDLMPKSPEPMDFDLGEGDDAALDLDFDSPIEEPGAGELELPDMDETAVISSDDMDTMSGDTGSSEELEFDLSETEAIEESAGDEEFSLDIEPSELDLGATTEESGSEDELDLGLDMDMGADSDIDLGADLDLDMGSEADLDLDMGAEADLDLDMGAEADLGSDLDLDMGLDADLGLDMSGSDLEVASDSVADDSMDLGLDMSMEAEDGEIDLTDAASDLGLSQDDGFGDVDLSEPLDAEEVTTKLDLARAYIDMGDHEGARDILEEVVTGGNTDQKKEAEELMAQAS